MVLYARFDCLFHVDLERSRFHEKPYNIGYGYVADLPLGNPFVSLV